MERLAISSSLEDYLEAIAEIIEVQGHAHTKEIAEKLNVKMPSVTNALQALSSRGLIRYQSHSPVYLTASGAETAAVIRHRHSVLKTFFQNILKLESEEADDAACKIEHIIGEKVLSRFVLLTEAISSREDCTALREYLDDKMPLICIQPGNDLVSLGELEEGQRGIVMRVSENLRGIKKFADLGLVSGTLVEMEGSSLFGDLIRIKAMGTSLSLRRNDARHIWLKRTE